MTTLAKENLGPVSIAIRDFIRENDTTDPRQMVSNLVLGKLWEMFEIAKSVEPVLIPIEERWSELGEEVLVLNHTGFHTACHSIEEPTHEESFSTYHYWWSEDMGDEVYGVTHWIPLPQVTK